MLFFMANSIDFYVELENFGLFTIIFGSFRINCAELPYVYAILSVTSKNNTNV